jgi:hypothetical protein
MWTSGDPVETVLLEEEVDGLLEVHGQHPQLFSRLRPQVDRQDALALATRRPGSGFRLRLDHGVGRRGSGCGSEHALI